MEKNVYRCYYCDTKTSSLTDAVDHSVRNHAEEELKYRTLILDESSGKRKYLTKVHVGVYPKQLEIAGKHIRVQPDGRIVIESTDTSKRKKLNTPTKEESRARKSLFEDLEDTTETDTENDCNKNVSRDLFINAVNNILSDVFSNLEEVGQSEIILQFLTMVARGFFPLYNIAYILFLDVVRWYACSCTSQMRYNEEAIKFWKVGFRFFHGKFLRFMSGVRNLGFVLDNPEEKGFMKPEESQINFAVPSRQHLYSKVKHEVLLPGISDVNIKTLSESMEKNIVKLAVDGKQISRGKGSVMGDVDLWGYEPRPTLSERQSRLQEELNSISKVESTLEKLIKENSDIVVNNCTYLVNDMQQSVKTIGNRLKDLREVSNSLELSEKKVLKMAGEDWRKSRFFPLIASIRVNKRDVQDQISDGLKLSKNIAMLGAELNGCASLTAMSDKVDMTRQGNYLSLSDEQISVDSPRLVKQKSPEWFQIRNNALVTGSTCNTALGLGKLCEQQQHYDKVFGQKRDEVIVTDQQKQRMAYGSEHEIDAIATLTSVILPFFFPTLTYVEEGCMKIGYDSNDSFMVVSPDGSLRKDIYSPPIMMYENKCKSPDAFSPYSYYEIPSYYATQLLSEMKAYDCTELLFTCWSETSTTVFKVTHDENLWKEIWTELLEIYGKVPPTGRPKRFSEGAKEIKKQISSFLENNIEFLGEFPSSNATSSFGALTTVGAYLKAEQHETSVNGHDITESLCETYRNYKTWTESAYQLCRTVAVEILVYMVSDLDRKFDFEVANSHLIAYAMKGKSMNIALFRQMMHATISALEANTFKVLVTAADGQWHNYGVKDETNRPLTLHQLHRDHWIRTKSQSAQSLRSKLVNMYRVKDLTEVVLSRSVGRTIIVEGHLNDPFLTISDKTRAAVLSALKGKTVINSALELDGGEKENGACLQRGSSASEGLIPAEVFEGLNEEDIQCLSGLFINAVNESREEISRNEFQMEIDGLNESDTVADYNLSGSLICDRYGFEQEMTFNGGTSQNMMITEDRISPSSIVRHRVQTQLESASQDMAALSISSPVNSSEVTSCLSNAFDVLYGHPPVRNDQLEFTDDLSNTVCVSENLQLEFFNLRASENIYEECQQSFYSDSNVSNISFKPEMDSKTMTDKEDEIHETEIGSLQTESRDCILTDAHLDQMLQSLQTDKNATSKQLSWQSYSAEMFAKIFKSRESISRTFTIPQLRKCLSVVQDTLNERGIIWRKGWKKEQLVCVLWNARNTYNYSNDGKPKPRRRTPPSLRKLCTDIIRVLNKDTLSAIIAECTWQNEYNRWSKDNLYPSGILIEGTEETIDWFSQPGVEAGSVRYHFTDSCHLLTCLRTKLCTTGIKGLNIKAWEKAALSPKTSLNIALVTDCVDKQSVTMARRVFAADVEQFMLEHDEFQKEALFCKLIREWFESVDQPRIDVQERCRRRLRLRRWLLEGYNVGRFPPHTQYIKGIPVTTYEALIVHIERSIQIFPYLNNGYNVRAIGTQEVEQFFSAFKDMDPAGSGTPKPDAIPDMMSAAIEIDNFRLDPRRSFCMRTSHASVYPMTQLSDDWEYLTSMDLIPDVCELKGKIEMNQIHIRNHDFDQPDHGRKTQRRKSGKISLPDKPACGERGVRQYHRKDDSKILAFKRKGLTDIPE